MDSSAPDNDLSGASRQNLPRQRRAKLVRAKPLLILDLDETLVYTTEGPLPGRTHDFVVGDLHVHKRPGVDQFLRQLQEHYELAVWSAGGAPYVEPTVAWLFAGLDAPTFVWSSRRCTRRFDHESHQEYFIKDLRKVRKLGFDGRRMLIVDDLQLNSVRNYGAAVYVRSYQGEADDEELVHLVTYLAALASEPNFRTVEKRYWRDTVRKSDV
ncbi:MAG: HAD family hydrolase [Candidatus Obscuribacter sp.]|nr:HAD family hydrolase [Candidatus Obscuribacter sp.]